MAKKVEQSKKGGRKIGRAAEKGKSYRAAGTRERNKEKKVRKHLKRHPNDKAAENYLGV